MYFHFIILVFLWFGAAFSTSVPTYNWSPVAIGLPKNATMMLSSKGRKRVFASELVGGHPVYMSMTSIHSRIQSVAKTIESLLNGDVLPTHIYLTISKEPFMLDKGVNRTSIPKALLHLSEKNIFTIVYTENIGPHRKLLPILSKYWKDYCVIVTVDDDVIYHRSTLAELIKYYILSGRDSVVALRSRRIGLCASNQALEVSEYKYWPLASYGIREMLQLPTGTGGILYRPDFFHPIVFDRKFLSITSTGDDIAFRLACMVKDVPVVTACRVSREHGGTASCPDTYRIKNVGGFEKLSKIDTNITARYLASTTIVATTNRKDNLKEVSNINLESIITSNRELLSINETKSSSLSSSSPPPSLRILNETINLWIVNMKGKNIIMWNNAVNYIEKTLNMNFNTIYNFYYLKERKECIENNTVHDIVCAFTDKCVI